MKRRETFGTSGPRIEPRFYAGAGLPSDLCDAPDFVERSQQAGVPMGGTLASNEVGASGPRFAVAANADPAAPGLERLQIIKGWVDDEGRMHQRVHDVATAPDASAVPPASCGDDRARGRRSLCAVWTDPEFDASRPAVYYARILQVPTCRWSRLQCELLTDADRPASCGDPSVPEHVRERAWTSPIWYENEGS